MSLNIILFLLQIVFLVNTHKKLDCIYKYLFYDLAVPQNSIENLENYYNTVDFDQQVELTQDNMHMYIHPMDYSTMRITEMMLRSYPVQSSSFKRAVSKCNLSMQKILENCNKKYNGDCEIINTYTVSKKCPIGYNRVSITHCAPFCPSGYNEVNGNPYYCSKTIRSNRSETFNDAYNVQKVSYRQGTDLYKCPKGFLVIGHDICIRACPFGWEDMGDRCLKPRLIIREHELFYYQFSYDDEAENIAYALYTED